MKYKIADFCRLHDGRVVREAWPGSIIYCEDVSKPHKVSVAPARSSSGAASGPASEPASGPASEPATSAEAMLFSKIEELLNAIDSFLHQRVSNRTEMERLWKSYLPPTSPSYQQPDASLPTNASMSSVIDTINSILRRLP